MSEPAPAHPTPAVIVGAGPAGLAVAACLQRRGVACVLLERETDLAAVWQRHYQRLHLHTDKGHSALPYLPFAADVPRYPGRDQVVAYLRAYAEHFQMNVQLGCEAHSIVRDGAEWRVQTNRGDVHARHLVLATGHAATPQLPDWPGQESFGGAVLHSSRYRSGLPFRGSRVLVVGAGNSGHEIALDLLEHGARVYWSLRSGTNVVPRDPLGLPLLSVALALDFLPARWRDALTFPLRWWLYRDLPRHGLRALPFGPFQQIERLGRVPIIDTGIAQAVRSGAVRIVPDILRFGAGQVVLQGGRKLDIGAVILATGYRPGALYSPALAGAGNLYTCGTRVVPTGMLHAIAAEARHIAVNIARQERSA